MFTGVTFSNEPEREPVIALVPSVLLELPALPGGMLVIRLPLLDRGLARLRLLAPPFHQFLMALSLLPLFSRRAISAHFLPSFPTSSSMTAPSSSDIGDLLSEGLRF